MKQSKKLLSIFLAMLMLLGTVSVVANAAQQKVEKGNIAYDSIDNAVLTPEQVANTVLDVLDRDVMPGLGVIDENLVVIKIKLNLTSIDTALSDVVSLLGNGLLSTVAGGDAQKLIDHRTDLCVGGNKNDPYQRSDGDLEVVYALLQFLGNEETANVLSKAVYGVLTDDGVNIGGLNGIVGGLVDLGEINGILTNVGGFATEMVYDLLIHGSYNANYADKSYPSMDELKEAGQGLPSEVNTLDKLLETAVMTFLTKPQKYEYVPTGEYTTDENGKQVPVTKKVWDEESYLLKADQLAGKDLSLAKNSIFTILDQCLQTAYTTFGKQVLNHDLKKIFMEAMDVDFVTLDAKKDAEEIAKIKADPAYVNVEDPNVDTSSVKNYLVNAQMWKVDGVWYFRDYVTRPILDANGNLQYTTDDEGNQVVVEGLQHRYQRAEAYDANDLYGIFNWDYVFTDDTFNFDQLIPQYGSIIGCLNHILHVALEKAVNPAAIGVSSIDQLWADGGNDNFNENLMTTAKFLLKNFTFEFFGRNPLYVDLNTLKANDAFIAKINSFENNAEGREGLIAYMLLPFLGDALPQLVYDLDMFTTGLQIEQVAALLVREFLSDLTPQINYDDQIFVDASLKSGRKFQTKTSAQWFELILNMGLDLAAVYLDNISNFNVDLDTLAKIKGYAVAKGAPAYMGVLEEIVDWAVDYVADGTGYSVINGLEPATLGSVRCVTSYNHTNDTVTVADNYAGNAFDILSRALNTLLPLGLLVGVSSDSYALDVKKVFDKLIDVIDDLDLEVLLGVFGRNGRDDNLLGAKNIPAQILGVVNKLITALFGKNLLTVDKASTEPINNALKQANLKTTIYNLVTGLNSRKVPLLRSALPVVAVFVDDWGSEQAIRTPELNIDRVVNSNNGTLDHTFTLRNGSRGLWRGYMSNGARAQDEQYAYNIVSISSAQGLAFGGGFEGNLTKGATKSVIIKGSVPATGLADRIDIAYQVYNEDNQLMENGKTYTKSYYVFFNYLAQDTHYDGTDDDDVEMITSVAFDISSDTVVDDIKEFMAKTEGVARWYNGANSKKTVDFKNTGTATQGAFTMSSKSQEKAKEETWQFNPFTFNEGAFNVASLGNGAIYNFTHTFYRSYKQYLWSDETIIGWKNNKTTSIILYNGELKSELESYLDEVISLNRMPADYTNQNAYNTYLAALANAMMAAYNPLWDGNVNLDFGGLKTALENAIADLDQYKVDPNAGGDTVGSAIVNLKSTLNSVDAGFGGKDYRTYMLYRWHRYQDAKNDANRAINLYEEYSAGLQTKKFEYSSMPVYQLKTAIAGDQYEGYILALLKDLNEEELAQAKENFTNVSKEFGGYNTQDIAQISNLVTRMSGRLLSREGGVVNTYLAKEIESARTEIGTTNNAGYSTRSWNAYYDAFTKAEAAMTSDSQDVIFNAKYALQVARNNLRTTAEEADYSELETLMSQATAIFWNPALYNNSNAEIGAVLAAWGYTTTNGTDTDIFPGSAKAVNARSYDKGDQEEVDEAADALKAALSKMVFKGASYGGATVENSQVPTGEVDENDVAIKETVKTTVIDAKQLIEAVTAKFAGTTANGATDAEVRVSLDDSYTLTSGNEKFVGTGATITIYTTQSGVKIPLSTIKVVVKGDVTGDGVIDVLDCMLVELVGTDKTTVSGVYSLAGDIANDGKVGIEDLGAVANLAKQTH